MVLAVSSVPGKLCALPHSVRRSHRSKTGPCMQPARRTIHKPSSSSRWLLPAGLSTFSKSRRMLSACGVCINPVGGPGGPQCPRNSCLGLFDTSLVSGCSHRLRFSICLSRGPVVVKPCAAKVPASDLCEVCAMQLGAQNVKGVVGVSSRCCSKGCLTILTNFITGIARIDVIIMSPLHLMCSGCPRSQKPRSTSHVGTAAGVRAPVSGGR